MMLEPLETDVLIVGAGPTGLMLGAQLARYGVKFIICDKNEGVTHLSKALVVHARTLEIYDQMGLAQTAVASGAIVENAALMNHGQVKGKLEIGRFGGELSEFSFFLVFEQSKNERMLCDHLHEGGHEVNWQHELQSLAHDENGVRAVFTTPAGDEQVVAAKYLVGCDGASSKTRKLLDLGFEGSTYPRMFYVADIEAAIEAEPNTSVIAFDENAFVLLFPLPGENHWRLLGNLPDVALDEHGSPKVEVTFDLALEKARRVFGRPLEIANLRWFSNYKVHTRHATTFSKGRCFVAGDAAHVHTPTGGQGMNTGLQDAYNLAWKLALTLRGEAGAKLLDTYNQERLANAKRLLQTTDAAFNVVAGATWYQNMFRNHVMPQVANLINKSSAGREFLFHSVSQIGINYRESSLSQHAGDDHFKVKAGDRMPFFKVDGTSVYECLRAPRFHLLAFSNGKESYRILGEHLARDAGARVDFHVLPLLPRVVEIFGTDKPFMILLRPDNYLAFVTSDVSLKTLDSYLSAILPMYAAPGR
jgi:2-polyprenyl-6-methoxyphenol hydroxylase-like FAD-dependent oxidoreductase